MFVEEYLRSGDHLEAAKKAGYKDTHTLRNQACKRVVWNELETLIYLKPVFTTVYSLYLG